MFVPNKIENLILIIDVNNKSLLKIPLISLIKLVEVIVLLKEFYIKFFVYFRKNIFIKYEFYCLYNFKDY
jgi:hypothetical protein